MTRPDNRTDRSGSKAVLLAKLHATVGRRYVVTDPHKTHRYRTGFRTGTGDCLAVVRPGSLLEMWQVLEACVAADVAIIVQAANTGLTGGSTPDPAGHQSHVVIVNTLRVTGIRLLREGSQVVCFAGSTLHELERRLAAIDREPHSVIGSSCFGASVVGGVCNNSGGALVRRGPAYTEMALFAQIGADGQLHLVNRLGISLGQSPEQVLARLDEPGFDIGGAIVEDRRCSATDYAAKVRDIDAATPARFNADPERLCDASGSAGKVAVFAVRLDTFPRERATRTFYIGSNDPDALAGLRRAVLGASGQLPIAAEYLHRDAFNLAERYGKDIFLAIKLIGTGRLPMLNRLKDLADRAGELLPGKPRHIVDRLLHALSRLLPSHLPKRMRDWRDRFDHHLLLKVPEDAFEANCAILDRMIRRERYFVCTPGEARDAFLHRFVIAGAAMRYRDLHADQVQDVLALDIALPRNARAWTEELPAAVQPWVLYKVYYGHFLCHVFHQDYVLRKGAVTAAIKQAMCIQLDARGAEYPAEHNVGRQYRAKPALELHYRQLDRTNRFNPGIGQTSDRRNWQ